VRFPRTSAWLDDWADISAAMICEVFSGAGTSGSGMDRGADHTSPGRIPPLPATAPPDLATIGASQCSQERLCATLTSQGLTSREETTVTWCSRPSRLLSQKARNRFSTGK
jgi:hypothetical protein